MNKPVIVALDTTSETELEKLLQALGDPKKTTIKIGMELFYYAGNQLVKKLADRGYKIFLDLKMHDIPNTVYHVAKQLAALGVAYTTIHALGGSEMIKQAKAGLISGTPSRKKTPKLLAVTELTSISEEILKNQQNCALSMKNQILSLAETAKKAGADGVVCSPLEVRELKQKLGNNFLYFTPRIRPPKSNSNDQKRIATPSQAKKYGSSAIIVGRPITLASNPKEIYTKIKQEFN